MRTVVIGAVAFAGGVAVGLLVAKLYVRSQVQGAADAALKKLGLEGGVIQTITDTYIVPSVT